jgi:hypothetical protein
VNLDLVFMLVICQYSQNFKKKNKQTYFKEVDPMVFVFEHLNPNLELHFEQHDIYQTCGYIGSEQLYETVPTYFYGNRKNEIG